MRDSEIRDIFLSAEEPVSPAVWKGVAAGLDARGRVVPFWVWGAVAFAAAAAVVLGVFLFKPADLKLESYSPSHNIVAQVVGNMPGGIVMPTPVVAGKAAYKPSVAPVATDNISREEKTSLEAIKGTGIAPATLAQKQSRPVVPQVRSTVPTVADDNALLNQLAFQEQASSSSRDISLLASGNMQASSRAQAFSRRAAASAQNQTEEGVYNPSQDKPGIPFSAGLGVRWNFTPRWAIGTGVRYTFMTRSFVADYQSGEGYVLRGKSVDNTQHWIGVPVNVYFNIVNGRHWKVHAFAGGAADYLLSNSFTIHSDKDIYWNKPRTSLQWSATTGAGVEYKIFPWLGVYLDPSVRYYFNQAAGADINGMPVHPVRFVVEGGLRFTL